MNKEDTTAQTDRVMHVLVEEESAIRTEWLRIAQAKDLLLMTYPDQDWLLTDIAKGVFRGNERFYLDCDMHGTRWVGVALAGVIKRRWPEAFTALVTAYPKRMFRDELTSGVLNNVFGKYPGPFENPAFTACEERFDGEIWTAMLAQLGTVH